jgi:nucleoside-diphosphate-sugar epimerase
MARWVVTGGVGFIGYHVCRAIAARGDDVVIIDDFCDAPYPRVEKERNARDLEAEHGGRVHIIHGCVTDRAALRPHFEGVFGVVHLAGLAGVRPSFRDPARTWRERRPRSSSRAKRR